MSLGKIDSNIQSLLVSLSINEPQKGECFGKVKDVRFRIFESSMPSHSYFSYNPANDEPEAICLVVAKITRDGKAWHLHALHHAHKWGIEALVDKYTPEE